MKLQDIKKEMLKYIDFYGGDLINSDEIAAATTKLQLEKIIERHRSHMEMMLSDAHSHLNNFKKKVGLGYA